MIESGVSGQPVELPAGFGQMPPGPELAVVLASIDRRRLHGPDLVELLRVRNRQVAWEQAQLLADVYELVHTPPHGGLTTLRTKDIDVYADVEVAFALAITGYAAGGLCNLACDLIDKVPAVHAAMLAGRVDLAKARLICDELADLESAEAQAVVQQVLGEAGNLTTGQLRERLRRRILSVNPEAVRRRHRKAVEARTVDYQTYANGTAALGAAYLPKEKAAAAWDHVDRIAHATYSAGDADGRELCQIRADVFADLLAGVDPTLAGAVTPAPRKGVVNLHVDLTTLLGLTNSPGELDGFGPLLADVTQQLTAQLSAEAATWRWNVTDDGQILGSGKINPRYRPTPDQIAHVRTRDRTCRAPGCRRPAATCDIDHIADWARGGTTTLANLALLCRRHHRAKHQGRYRIRLSRHGLEWITPRGKLYTVVPDHDLPHDSLHQLHHRIRSHHGPTAMRR